MHLLKPLTLLTLSSSALSFKINAYTNAGCTGNVKEINVYDNTCRNTDVIPTQSFKVLSYGAGRQRATFYGKSYCGLELPQKDWWADGGSDTFLKGRCITLSFTANAFGSRSA